MNPRLFLISLALFANLYCSGQGYWVHSFDYLGEYGRSNFIFDTVHTNNLWQIGQPNKAVFSAARSFPNVIVTDTSGNYPPLDTSVFYIASSLPYSNPSFMYFDFYYWLDIDSGSTAKFEISGDRGVHWIDALTEDTTYLFNWTRPKPRLDTSTNGWAYFSLNISIWSRSTPGGSYHFPLYLISDTIIYRFTFISGADTVHKDGWMMDDFRFNQGATVSEVNTFSADYYNSVYPNPATDAFQILNTGNAKVETIDILDLTGSLIARYHYPTNNEKLPIDFPSGGYLVKQLAEDGSVIFNRLTVFR